MLRCSEEISNKNTENTNARNLYCLLHKYGTSAFISVKELDYCFYLKLVAMVVSSGLSP